MILMKSKNTSNVFYEQNLNSKASNFVCNRVRQITSFVINLSTLLMCNPTALYALGLSVGAGLFSDLFQIGNKNT